VTAFNPNASAMLYSVLLGGQQSDYGYGIALDSLDNAYVVGQTLSTNFPTVNAVQSNRNGTNDAFIAEIILTVQSPEVTIDPTNQALGVGADATFVATVAGTPPFAFQWQLDGTNLTNAGSISGSTNNELFINPAEVTNSGNYSVIVTNLGGSVTSSVAILIVTNVAPIITQQPASQTVGIGSTVSFSVIGIDGTTPEFLQWLKDGANLMNGTNSSGSIISGSTNNFLTIADAQTNDDGAYSLVISNAWGVLTSSNAILTVLTAPDFGGITDAGGTNFILNGVGGTNNGTYFILTSTNLATPLNLWTPVATNHFGSQGQFIFTDSPPANTPQQFYILQMPSP
jgi:hypothetical protein